MRLALTSDIHIDTNGAATLEILAARVREIGPDVLVVAGDIATGAATYLRTLLALRAAAPEVMVVAGNHDVWTAPEAAAKGLDSWKRLDAVLPALCREAGVHLLDAGPVVLGGIGFAGSLGWYDLSTADPDLGLPLATYREGEWGGLRWNDHRLAVWGDGAGGRMVERDVADRLRARLAAHLATLETARVVAVTHTLPFAAQVARSPSPAWRFVNAFMGSTALGDLLLADPRVELAIAGHTHIGSELWIDRPAGLPLHAIVSPLGTTREWRGTPAEEAVARAIRVVDLRAHARGAGD